LIVANVQFGIIYKQLWNDFEKKKCKIPNCSMEQVKISQPRSIWCGVIHFPALHTFRKMKVPTSLTFGLSWKFKSWSL